MKGEIDRPLLHAVVSGICAAGNQSPERVAEQALQIHDTLLAKIDARAEREDQGWRLHDMPEREDLQTVVDDIWSFQRTTFPQATPASCAAHLLSEARELVEDPSDRLEWADVMMLALGGMQMAGIDPAAVLREKLEVNKKRKWGRPNAEGFVEHVREGMPLLLTDPPAGAKQPCGEVKV